VRVFVGEGVICRPTGWSDSAVHRHRSLDRLALDNRSDTYSPGGLRFQALVVLAAAVDARLWKKLEPRRRARRKLRPRLSKRRLKQLALREFAKARPPQECTGQWMEP
jgi:hypothetical protein